MLSFKHISSIGFIILLSACTTTRTAPPVVETPTEQSKPSTTATPVTAAINTTPTPPVEETANSSAIENTSSINSNPIAETSTSNNQTQQSKLLQVNVFHFDYDSADLSDDALLALQAHAEYLQSHPKSKIQINGHTDSRGTREYNMALGERRAKSITSYLLAHNVNTSQIEVVSFGEEKPLLDEESESAWAENRRAEIEYTQQKP